MSGDLVPRLRFNATPELVMKAADRIAALEAAMRDALAVCTEPKVYRILDVALTQEQNQ